MGAKADATKDAHELIKLLGKGWKPHVWENLGEWHAAAVKPPFTIYVNGCPKYHLMMADKPNDAHCGTYRWNSSAFGNNPVKLVRQVSKRCLAFVQSQLNLAVHVSKIVQALPKK